MTGRRLVSSVESSDISWRRRKSGGIKIICQSDVRDFSAMAFITDHVHSLIEQWFPGQCATTNPGLRPPGVPNEECSEASKPTFRSSCLC